MLKFILLSLIIVVQSFPQNNEQYLTQGAENGYAWLQLNQPTNTIQDYKYNYLASMLENQRIMIQYGKKPKLPLGCLDDIAKLNESGKSDKIDLTVMIKLIDGFYLKQENLIIPIIGAYCYCVKSLTDITERQLENYRQQLLNFSRGGSE